MKITKKFLKTEYLKKKKPIIQIAKKIGKSYDYIRDRLIKYNIPRRTHSEAALKYNLTKEFLKKEYLINKNSACKIAKQIKCSPYTIIKNLKQFNIKTRTLKESKRIGRPYNYKGGRPNCKCGKLIWYGFKECKHCARIRQWKNPKYRTMIVSKALKGLQLKPNKPEKIIRALLNKILPKECKFVGDGKVIIDRFNPDFINVNGQKKIIELYGDYWHNRKEVKTRDKNRIKTYTKYGYKTLIIWEHELKDLKKVEQKLVQFNKGIK